MRPENIADPLMAFCQIYPGSLATVILIIAARLSTRIARPRIVDIVDFEGVRENILVGYGLVIGLNGTGDALNSAIFTREVRWVCWSAWRQCLR